VAYVVSSALFICWSRLTSLLLLLLLKRVVDALGSADVTDVMAG